ncbi:MAG TPA: reverse transcriptase domain-containing protein [Candidatus Paceibacterota bacterium]|nr:reverse transcriptase domain-containing protein [Candidatus Paceibacterota bacterium]
MAIGKFIHSYESIISVENLLEAWKEFIRGKRHRADVQEFELNLMGNVLSLHSELAAKTYKHSPYEAFNISDPKPRNIHKAAVRDRLLHHALYRKLYPYFDKTFVPHSYSCRRGKGGHKALDCFRSFAYQVSRNHTRTVWVLKCDIRKFFASIDHACLTAILRRFIEDENILWLLSQIIESFHSTEQGVGLPLGNLTSQLLVNVYMNEFDHYVARQLRIHHYIRYADDFVFMSADKQELVEMLPSIRDFLWNELRLTLHPDKVSIRTIASGVDFLGWVHFPDHRVLRTTTKRRMFRGIRAQEGKEETVQSYFGLMSHGNAKKLHRQIEDELGRL